MFFKINIFLYFYLLEIIPCSFKNISNNLGICVTTKFYETKKVICNDIKQDIWLI